MRRRDFIPLFGIGASLPLVTWAQAPRSLLAQQSGAQVIGFLSVRPPDDDSEFVAAFLQGLNKFGYVQGQNVSIEYQWAIDYDQLPALARSLVDRRVSVIVAPNIVCAAAAKAATRTIPIVFTSGIDPVKLGLVASLNHPDANLTGIGNFTAGLAAKRLGFLRELLPGAALIAVLINPKNRNAEVQLSDLDVAVRANGLRLLVLNASTDTDIDIAFATLAQRRADALIIGADPMFFYRRDRLVALAAVKAIPAVYEWRIIASAGGLMSYGTDLADIYRRLGIYVGRILKGATPADLPVERATKFELVINLKTAKALGLTIPPSLLAQADEVIE